MTRILITGGAGFIGSNLAQRAVQRGWDVTVLDDLSTGHLSNVDLDNTRFVQANVQDTDSVKRAAQVCDSIIHLGALGSVPRSIADPFTSHHANATGTLSVLEASRHTTGHVLTASSSSVYGMNPALPKAEREWVRPMSPYAVSKLATEQYTLAFQNSFGIQSVAFRFFNVYGPGQRAGHTYAAVIPKFIDALLNEQALQVFGDGQNSRDFTYVGTVCDVLLRGVAERTSAPEPVNLAFGTNTTLLDLIRHLESLTGISATVEFKPPRPGDVPHSQADNSSLMTLFPDVVRTPMEEGLSETLAWFSSL